MREISVQSNQQFRISLHHSNQMLVKDRKIIFIVCKVLSQSYKYFGISLDILQIMEPKFKQEIKQQEEDYFDIDGIKVNRYWPFIVERDRSRELLQNQQNIVKVQNNQHSIEPIFFFKPLQEVQPIDQQMLRYRSVSSLRDFRLFGPPGMNACKETPQKIEKKTLYINEFDQFDYNKEKKNKDSQITQRENNY